MEMAEVLDAVQREIVAKTEADPQRAESYYGRVRSAVKEVLGIDPQSKARQHRYVLGRWIVCYLMTNYGIGASETARLMKRTHSSVLYLRGMMNEAVIRPNLYPAEAQALVDVQELLNSQKQ